MLGKPGHSIGLLGRILAILAFTVMLEAILGALYYERLGHLSLREDEARRLAEHLVISRKLLMDSSTQERPHLAVKLTTDRYDIHWVTGTKETQHQQPQRNQIYRQIVSWEPSLEKSDLRVRLESPGRKARITGALQLPDRSWIYFKMLDVTTRWDLAVGRIALALAPVLCILAVGALLIRRALHPLRELTHATERIGNGQEVMVKERGTEDVRRLVRAFNAMQQRIHRLISDRTQMLASVGHDMRTPIARLKLRLETIEDQDTAEAVANDISEITAMIDSLLTFLAGDKDPEKPVSSDLAVIAATLVDEFRDIGKSATYEGPDHLEITIRQNGIRRAIRNLMDNALHYGSSARLKIYDSAQHVVIRIEDDGPGIPEEQLSAVLQPFIRLDQARSRNTKGLGLGLAIVARVVELEQGELSLVNRHGLCVEIKLAKNAAAKA